MSRTFQLVRKKDDPKTRKPVDLSQVDYEISRHLGIEYDSHKFVASWFTRIGKFILENKQLGSISMREKVNDIAEELRGKGNEEEADYLINALNYLEERYVGIIHETKEVA